MTKTILSALFLIASTLATLAMPVRPGMWKTIKLTDGTEIRAEIRGDEHCVFMQSADGRTFLRVGDTNIYEEKTPQSIHEMAYNARKAKALAAESNVGTMPRKASYMGQKKCLCILVDFQDKKFTYDASLFRDMLNKVGYKNEEFGHIGSVRDYFLEQSYGKFDIEFDVVGPYTLDHGYKYYGSDAGGAIDINIKEFAREAITLADDDVNYRDYDWDGDRNCEAVYIIYAGVGEIDQNYDPDVIWPVQGAIPNPPRLDRVNVSAFACGPELSGVTGKVMGIGTICHEYSHNLGLCDTYDVDYQCGVYGVSFWDLMSYGNYNDDNVCNKPSGYNAFEKWQAGWLEPKELKGSCEITAMKPLSSSEEAYIIYNENDSNEYYLIENRQPEGFDSGLPGSGLLIYHVDYDQSAWFYNVVNCTQSYPIVTRQPRFTLVCADNSYTTDRKDMAGDAYPYGNNNALTATSIPSAAFYHPDPDGNTALGCSIKNIKRNADGTISFKFQVDGGLIDDPLQPIEPVLGDVNGDGEINVFDIVALSEYILNGGKIDTKAADYNKDGDINVFDVVGISDFILAK